jgi:hypothetical protein
MAKKKNGFDTAALLKYADRLDELGGSDALKRATAAGMAEAKKEINRQVTTAMQQGNLPAGGKYSTGDTLDSLDENLAATWNGDIASLPVGFDMSKSGIVSILLMYGTPKMPPVAGLKDALYGKKGKAAARKAQEAAIQKIIERLGG